MRDSLPASKKHHGWNFWDCGLWVAFCLVVVSQVLQSFQAVSPFNGGIIDGPFQLFNWLRRIDDGQIPGRDFQCFHGIGVPYLHYPFYRVFGSDLFAMELSRQLICRIATLAAYLFISRIATKSYTLGIFWSLTTMIPTIDWGSDRLTLVTRFFITNVLFAYAPGDSMYGLRGLLPLVFVATCLLPPTRKLLLAQAALLSGSFFCGIENGMALLMGLLATILLLLGCSIYQVQLIQVAKRLSLVLLGGVIITFLILLGLLGVQGIPRFLAFHFHQQIQDQTWFFGAPPNSFLLDGNRSTLLLTILSGLMVVAAGIYVLWQCSIITREKNEDQINYLIAKIVGLNFGVITLASLLGYIGRGGTANFYRVIFLFLSLYLYRKLAGISFTRGTQQACNTLLAALILFMTFICYRHASVLQTIGYSEPHQQHLSLAEPIAEDHRRQLAQPHLLWSAFSGSYEAKLGIQAPTEWDYIFHALGPDRQEYSNQFLKYQPKYVTTTKNDKNLWEEWLRTSVFPFYRTLLFHYKIIAETPFVIIWQRVEDDRELAVSSTPIDIQPLTPQSYVIPAVPKDEELVLYVIDVEYETKNPIRWLPLLGNSARYLIHVTGAKVGYDISLPPYLTKHSFPVIPVPGQEFRLDFQVRGIRWDATIDIKKVTATKITLDPANKLFLKPSVAYKGEN
jgi:hypothetical protein